jgi:hypothetical protein
MGAGNGGKAGICPSSPRVLSKKIKLEKEGNIPNINTKILQVVV